MLYLRLNLRNIHFFLSVFFEIYFVFKSALNGVNTRVFFSITRFGRGTLPNIWLLSTTFVLYLVFWALGVRFFHILKRREYAIQHPLGGFCAFGGFCACSIQE